MPHLVLWDIDHTLIESRGVGRELSAAAFEQVTGQPMRDQAKIDGITEAVIFRETATMHGITTGRSDFERFAQALTEQHMQQAAKLRERGSALPGAAAALDALAAANVRQTVVTGNVRAVAEIKLDVFGLDTHIDWDAGAYGEDADLRPALVDLALARSSTTAADAVLIGDTPADVEGGRENGVRVIAVATGRSSAADLREAGADVVLDDLTDVGLLVTLITGGK
ncbi:phosphoglycolate phosphatase [Streptomyces sp. Tu 6176]|uniref:HAD family hydrolase n=1 Tax=Streptomyces sp. Tu 6176 TaxID=1470557 RepID=UPI00044A1A46|nr:haloacid dehalogenase-like hydrolase [Streptomyces sp. Tu 6176]EYT79351.1 phosphoglycolate phosphatase [Streptomyces sp. Tu 6176]